MHGYEIANSIQRISDDVLQVEEGSLYPAFAADAHQRMGNCEVEHGRLETAAARYYQLTGRGSQTIVGRNVTVRTRHRGDHACHSSGLKGSLT